MLEPFPYYHETTDGGECIAGWGIWCTDDNEALLDDGFATQEQASEGIKKLKDRAVGSIESFLEDSFEYSAADPDAFEKVFGHEWMGGTCHDKCIYECNKEEKSND